MLVSYQAPLWSFLALQGKLCSQSPMSVTTDAHRAWAVAVVTGQG